jgi:hypothetical protein
MQAHYSTVNGGEQREALAKVIRLVDHRAPVIGCAFGNGTSPNSAPGGEVSGEDSLAGGEVLKSGAL